MTSLSDGLVKLEQIVVPLVWDESGCEGKGIGGITYAMSEGRHGIFALYHPYHGDQGSKDWVRAEAEAHYLETMAGALNLEPILSEIKGMREALGPFVNVRDQYPESAKLINSRLDGLTLVSVQVTKDQLKAAIHAFGALSTLSPQEPDK